MLGLATGSTPIGVYRELIRMHREEGLSFRGVVTFNLDEYYPMTPESIHSYHRFMQENLFDHVDIDPADTSTSPTATCRATASRAHGAAYEAAIARGRRHRLPAPRHRQDRPHRLQRAGLRRARAAPGWCTLDAITRRDAAADFFGEENVPREAITMGVATILEAREIAILATGEHKSAIVRRAVEGEVDLEVAATFLQRHPNTTFYLDAAAAADLTRVATPWLVDEVEWTPELAVRAVVWLSLTDRARRSSSSRSATTPSTSCRRWWRGTARRAR